MFKSLAQLSHILGFLFQLTETKAKFLFKITGKMRRVFKTYFIDYFRYLHTILWNFKRNSNETEGDYWTSGNILDPGNGKTYTSSV